MSDGMILTSYLSFIIVFVFYQSLVLVASEYTISAVFLSSWTQWCLFCVLMNAFSILLSYLYHDDCSYGKGFHFLFTKNEHIKLCLKLMLSTSVICVEQATT